MSTPTPESIALAALAGVLHDIGKFALRANAGDSHIRGEQAQRDFKYRHAMLSAGFVDTEVPEPWRRATSAVVGNHHRPRPEHVDDLAVTLADILSAAAREDGIQDEDVRQSHPRQLRSIFAQLAAPGGVTLGAAARERAYLPLKPLTLARDTLFPGPALPPDQVWADYARLYEAFLQDARRLAQVHEAAPNLQVYLESMLHLLQRYTWSVPSAYDNDVPDVSLYDHSRTTAALAAILTASGHDAPTLRQWVDEPKTETPLALLVGADLSGVQDFIYTITNQGATSALRGRSFYLQLLTEAAARWVLRELDLPITNLLYVGGGNFYLLAAPEHADKLARIQQHISRALLQHHRGDLYLALASVPLRGVDFFDGRIRAAWRKLNERQQAAKLRRFVELDGEDQALVFAPQEDGGNEERQCQVCGQEHPHTQIYDEVRKCPPCLSYEELGRDLRRARFLLLEHVEPTPVDLTAPPGDYAAALAALGMRVRVTAERPPTPEQRATLLALADDAWAALEPHPHLAVGRRFLVNTTPLLSEADIAHLQRQGFEGEEGEILRAGHIKPFSVLARESKGIKRLGVLRMDVDNLGLLFAEGLDDLTTLSRVASLSLAVSLYFEGWVEQVAEQHAGRLYSIYSGGDDLFFVGAWDAVVEFARQVRADFTPYAAHHPGLHTSAGVALVGSKYPLAQAARDAGNDEAQAKAYRGPDGQRKDAVSFLGEVQPWTRFGLEAGCAPGSHSVHALAHLLQGMVAPDEGEARVPRTLLRNLVQLYDQYQEKFEERRQEGRDVTKDGTPQALWGPWMWRGVYMLNRMADRLKQQPALQRQVDDLRRNLEQEQFRNMDWIGLAARWAELLTR